MRCLSPCLTCNTDVTICTSCISGYYLNSTNSCIKCMASNCLKCSDDGTRCLTCVSSYSYLPSSSSSICYRCMQS